MTTLPTGEPNLRRLIDAVATYALPTWRSRRYGVTLQPGEWLEGLILTESSGNPRASRYEPHLDRANRRDAAADPDTCDVNDGDLEDDRSYGLCQILGSNVRSLCGAVPLLVVGEFNHRPVRAVSADDEDAFWAPMSFAFAFLPAINLSLGARLLRGELSAVGGGDVERALARYNGGPTGDDIKPEYGNDMRLRAYVDRIVKNSRTVIADRAAIGWTTPKGI